MRPILGLCAFNMAVAVAIGAFGSHGLKATLSPASLETFRIGSNYHLIHGLGALLVLVIPTVHISEILARRIAWTMLTGILFFCGALYALAISGQRVLGAIAPIGGSLFIASWVWLALALWRGKT